MHWADKIAEQLKKSGRDSYTCAAGITPSGTVHIGNFRDIITSDAVKRSLGASARLIFIWDDYDRLRKIPSNVPESFASYLGQPISDIPDPWGCHSSYARHFQEEFEAIMPELGVEAEFIYQSERYKKNYYYHEIVTAMNKRHEIAEIMSGFKTTPLSPQEIEEYYPLQVYCQKCLSSLETKITNWDGKNVSYTCSCGHTETVNLEEKNIGKLAWKVDWAMRWMKENVSFEPGGWDHSSPGGSYHVSSKISKKVYSYNPPYYQGYGFVGLGGITKMSSSKGTGIRPADILEIYEPELLRWMFTNVIPNKPITFFFDSEVIRQYDSFDRRLEQYETLPVVEKRAIELAGIDGVPEPRGVSFRQIASFGQIVQGDVKKLSELMNQPEKNLTTRLKKSEKWIEKHAPEMKIVVGTEPNTEYYNSLSETEKENIQQLKNSIEKYSTTEDLTKLVYDIPKKENQTEEEKKECQRNFFRHIYQLLLKSDTGPRLPTFLLALGQEKIKQLLP